MSLLSRNGQKSIDILLDTLGKLENIRSRVLLEVDFDFPYKNLEETFVKFSVIIIWGYVLTIITLKLNVTLG